MPLYLYICGGSQPLHTHHHLHRPIKIKNESGGKTEVYWVSPGDGQMVLQSPDMANGQELSLSKCMIYFWHDRISWIMIMIDTFSYSYLLCYVNWYVWTIAITHIQYNRFLCKSYISRSRTTRWRVRYMCNPGTPTPLPVYHCPLGPLGSLESWTRTWPGTL